MTYSPNSSRRQGRLRWEIRKGLRTYPENSTLSGDPYVSVEEACKAIEGVKHAAEN
jgi:hypothetical protein